MPLCVQLVEGLGAESNSASVPAQSGDSRCLSFNPTFGLRWASGRSGSRIADGFAMANYEQIAGAAMEKLDGMCWPVEWFKEDLPGPKVWLRAFSRRYGPAVAGSPCFYSGQPMLVRVLLLRATHLGVARFLTHNISARRPEVDISIWLESVCRWTVLLGTLFCVFQSKPT